jgi:hypothetical protein
MKRFGNVSKVAFTNVLDRVLDISRRGNSRLGIFVRLDDEFVDSEGIVRREVVCRISAAPVSMRSAAS